uniref:Ectonucleoside triphosphate diphosphohydrolase 2a, tandem duplicate 2 n=1 Tax=Seriola lalandi dorsalis TaxID=1841481 RepID=A0A3B4X733_SERLL
MALRFSQTIPAVVLLILSIVGIILLVLPAKEVEAPPENMYGIVLDAGSSHTSMYIYKWPANKQNGTGIVTQHSECHAKGGGISSYAGVRGGAAESLKVLDFPVNSGYYTNITASIIMHKLKQKMRSYPFSFKEATILSGSAEGAYGWVTVNYLNENFAKYGFAGRWLHPGRETIGALDLGGASTQITFETSVKVEDSSEMMELTLYGQVYRVYTHSFLCYGQDQFLRRLTAHLIKTQGVTPHINHPCYPKQFNMSIKLGKDVFNSPCTQSYRPAQFDPQMSVMVVGTGDYHSCQGNVQKIFSFDNCSYSKCSFDRVFQPSVRGQFMAFSAYFFTHKYISHLSNIPITSPSQMEAAIQLVCNMTISEVLSHICAVSNFVQVLLMQGYGFNELSFPSISFQEKAGGASVGWALGYMLILSNMVPAESSVLMKALPSGPWAGILFLFIALLLFGVGYLLITIRNTRNKEALSACTSLPCYLISTFQS